MRRALAAEELESAREMRLLGNTLTDIAKRYDMSAKTAYGVLKYGYKPRKLSDEQIREIRHAYDRHGRSLNKLAKEYGVAYYTIWRVVNRVTYDDVI